MTTRIRLARGGTNKRPYYRVVVADQRAKRDGRFLERIGSYNPLLAENKCTIDRARAEYWLSVGARPTERVTKLLQVAGIEVPPVLLPRAAFFRGGEATPKVPKEATTQPAPEGVAAGEGKG